MLIEKLKCMVSLFGGSVRVSKDDLAEIIHQLEQADRMREALEEIDFQVFLIIDSGRVKDNTIKETVSGLSKIARTALNAQKGSE